jgi:glycosyltransferase involved in cell wall biosynthesis
MKISVLIPTYNPDADRLIASLQGLTAQTLESDAWECVMVDNASSPEIDLNWVQSFFPGNLKLVREPTPGLSHARLAGIRAAAADLLVFCDDDNVLDCRYLELALHGMENHPLVGVAGGKSLPVYLGERPSWYVEGMAPLGCQDFGDEAQSFSARSFRNERRYPERAPIGAGMVFRRICMDAWIKTVGKTGITDRKGKNLSSAGDCDMVLHALEAGYDIAYWPELKLHHLMPPERLEEKYLAAVSRAAFRDFVRVLDLHGIRPWDAISAWSLPLRVAKSWWFHRAWRGAVERIRWQSSIGQFEGRKLL